MALGLPDIGLGQIEADDRKPWPSLLYKIVKTPRAAANVEQHQPALVAPGNFAALCQDCGLTTTATTS